MKPLPNNPPGWGAIDASGNAGAAPISRAAIVAAAQSCIGTPFRHQGRLPGRFLDCSGHVLHSMTAGGWTPGDQEIFRTNYERRPNGLEMRAYVEQECTEIAPGAVLPADILLMRWLGDPAPQPRHLAVVTRGAPDIVICHTHRSFNEVREHCLNEWADLVLGAYRLKALIAQELA